MNMNPYTTISFPGLGIEWDPARSLDIGGFSIYFYGVIIATGLLLAVAYACKRSSKFGIREDDLMDGILWIVPVAVICARMYYVAFKWEEYAGDFLKIIDIRSGGLAIYGGVIGAGLCAIIHCKIKKMKLPAVLDLASLGFLIGQSIGRWGNFFNREAFGSETDSFLRMGLYNGYTGKWEYHHPTFLYESLWNLVGFVLLHFLSKRRKYDGQIALGYLAWYGLGRAWIEGLRTDSLYWGPFRVSQLLAAASCLIGVVMLIVLSFRPHEPAQLAVNQMALQAEKTVEEEPEAEDTEE